MFTVLLHDIAHNNGIQLSLGDVTLCYSIATYSAIILSIGIFLVCVHFINGKVKMASI